MRPLRVALGLVAVAAGALLPLVVGPFWLGLVTQMYVFGLLAEKSYTGLISYEAPNPVLWARSPYEVCREGFELTQALLREAARG